MLHPEQFEVNEAWIAFRLNRAPIRTEQDGDLNCIALMDAASCFILGSELVSAGEAELDAVQARRLLASARSRNQQLPRTLFVPREDTVKLLTREATQQEIEVVRIPECDLLVFIGEARQGFAERFEAAPHR